jgi:hypothetical protein
VNARLKKNLRGGGQIFFLIFYLNLQRCSKIFQKWYFEIDLWGEEESL